MYFVVFKIAQYIKQLAWIKLLFLLRPFRRVLCDIFIIQWILFNLKIDRPTFLKLSNVHVHVRCDD